MYSLIVRHKDQNIIHRTLTSDELSTLDGSGVQLIVNAFREYIGLDIPFILSITRDNFPFPLSDILEKFIGRRIFVFFQGVCKSNPSLSQRSDPQAKYAIFIMF